MASSVRTRSASPKSVSFSPVLERKYSADRLAPAPTPAPARPAAQPDLAPTHWRNYFNDFSAYLGEYSIDWVPVSALDESVSFYWTTLRYIGSVLMERWSSVV